MPSEDGVTVERLRAIYDEVAVEGVTRAKLWKPPYDEDTPEALWRFIVECLVTFDPTIRPGENVIRSFPDKEYLRFLTHYFYEARRDGRSFIIEKPRRMVISWLARAWDLWDAGVRKATIYVACQKYEDSARMIWRNVFMYQQLQKRFPSWGLPDMEVLRFKGSQSASKVVFANGSSINALTGEESNSFRQEGASRVVCEEIAFWGNLSSAWSNALSMVKSSPDFAGGHVIAITTPSGTGEYLAWKAGKGIATSLEAKDRPDFVIPVMREIYGEAMRC